MKPKSLTAVVKSYKKWKANSTGQQRAPSRIKKEVVSLLGRHTLKRVSSSLNITPGTLARWRDSCKKTTPPKKSRAPKAPKASFVEIVDELPSLEPRKSSKSKSIARNVRVELCRPSGEKICLEGDLTPEVAAALASGFFQNNK